MKKFKDMNENEKKKVKRNILIGIGGVTLLVGGYFIGKKVGRVNALKMHTEFGDLAKDVIVTQPTPLPKEITSIWETIDADIYTDIAMQMEEALCDTTIDQLHIDRSWNVAEGVVKNLKVTIDTVK